MTQEELSELDTLVKKLKFKASMKAGELHDLVEDQLWTNFEDIPSVAQETFKACELWQKKYRELMAAKKNV